MEILDDVQTGDDYTDAATLKDVWASSGGYAVVSVADAYVQLQYGLQGQTFWTNEVPIGQNSPLALLSGTVGVRFRSKLAGTPATINAALAAEAEPPIVITSPGTVSITAQSMLTGTVAEDGTIVDGSGFIVTHTGGTGLYTVAFGTSFASTPNVQATITDGSNQGYLDVVSRSPTGFEVETFNPATLGAADRGFGFLVSATQ